MPWKLYSFLPFLVIALWLPIFYTADADVTQNVVTGSRAVSVVYQNTSGYPKFVMISAIDGVSNAEWRVYSNSANSLSTVLGWCGSVVSVSSCSISWVVPNGYYYGVTDSGSSPSFNGWTEWDLASTTGGGTLAGLSDVQLTSPTSTNLLQYNGTKWVNIPASTLTIYPGGTTTPLYVQDAGNISFGIAWLVFFNAMLFLGMVWNVLPFKAKIAYASR